jgi:hypothetical protein
LNQIENWADDLVQAGKRKLCLRFDSAASEHAHPFGLFARVLEEHRLANARLAADHQRRAARRSRANE